METVDQSAVFASFNDFRGDAVVSWRFVCRERLNCFVQLLDSWRGVKSSMIGICVVLSIAASETTVSFE